MRKILVTGGAGFIGSALVRHFVSDDLATVVNVDKLTYAGNLESLSAIADHPRHMFVNADICESATMNKLFSEHRPAAVINLAAESHVDRSIDGPIDFIQTNIVGTFTMLEAARTYWNSLSGEQQNSFRFIHVSTDEVFGSLGATGKFDEHSRYQPTSPYSASKAAADHLVRSWFHTYGLPTIISNCSNNFGPYQYPEKFVPVLILSALAGSPLPIYGRGDQIRDWLYVDDHVSAIRAILERGKVGGTYNIGSDNERSNLQVATAICELLDQLVPEKRRGITRYADLIIHVEDRPGHDTRYAIDASKITAELGWKPSRTFDQGLQSTISWYLQNEDWCEQLYERGAKRARQGLMRKVAR